MKNIILITIAAILFAGVFTALSYKNEILDRMSNQPLKEIFKAFHYVHKKHNQYAINSMEGLKRYKIFKTNVQWANQKNAELGKNIYGITQFMDLTHEEFVEKQLLKPEQMKKNIKEMSQKSLRFLEKKSNHDDDHNDDDHHDDDHHDDDHHDDDHHDDHHDDHDDDHDDDGDHNLKEKGSNKKKKKSHNLKAGEVDWRNWDSPVKDQGGCGSCWSFAAIGAIENIYHKLTGNLTVFSEQYLVDCDNLDGGCEGGWPTETFKWISKNGVIKQDLLNYKGSQGTCNNNLKSYEYKIVKGAKEFQNEVHSQEDWNKMLSQGPLVVAMDASFEGFGYYRSKTFDPITPKRCGDINHAVYVVGRTVENGVEYLLVRNSWGVSWGYNGYFKIPRSKNCGITSWGWLPDVYNGTVPDNKPNPNPEPVPTTDCVELYNRKGFTSSPILKACDSVPELDGFFFYGVKFPNTTSSGKPIKLMVFPRQECAGNWEMPVLDTTEFIKRNGRTAYTASLAFIKEPKSGCLDFYLDPCHKGNAEFSICNDINDTQFVNLSSLSEINSINIDSLSIKSVDFCTKPNFEGTCIGIDGKSSIYNMILNFRLGNYLESKLIRSIRITRN